MGALDAESPGCAKVGVPYNLRDGTEFWRAGRVVHRRMVEELYLADCPFACVHPHGREQVTPRPAPYTVPSRQAHNGSPR